MSTDTPLAGEESEGPNFLKRSLRERFPGGRRADPDTDLTSTRECNRVATELLDCVELSDRVRGRDWITGEGEAEESANDLSPSKAPRDGEPPYEDGPASEDAREEGDGHEI